MKRYRIIFLILSYGFCLCPLIAKPEDPENYKRRIEMHENALAGDVEAMHQLANFYLLNDEMKLAIHWYKKSGEEDYIPSLWRLGNLLNKHKDKQIYELSHKAFKDLIALEQYKAFSRLGDLYADKGSPYFDIKQAILYYKDGAGLKDTVAMMKLAKYYLGYYGDQVEHEKALPYILGASELNVAEAIRMQGMYLRYGLGGVEQNIGEGWKLYVKAAKLDDVQSMLDIANALYIGGELKKNHAQAKIYYERASKLGHTEAGLKLKTLKFELSDKK